MDALPSFSLNDVEKKANQSLQSTYIESNPDILGGTPIIKGTRIDVYTVQARLDGGDTIDMLTSEYPEIPVEAFEQAYRYRGEHGVS